MSNDDLNKRVTEKIQEAILFLMPEEEIRSKVDAEIEAFFNPTVDTYGRKAPSSFSKLLDGLLQKQVSDMMSKLLTSPQWQLKFNEDGSPVIGEAVAKVLGVSPDYFTNALIRAQAVAMHNSMLLSIANTMRNTGQWGLAEQLDKAFLNE